MNPTGADHRFEKIFDAYRKKKSLAEGAVKFCFDGIRLLPHKTPAEQGLEDGDLIETCAQQPTDISRVINMQNVGSSFVTGDAHEKQQVDTCVCCAGCPQLQNRQVAAGYSSQSALSLRSVRSPEDEYPRSACSTLLRD